MHFEHEGAHANIFLDTSKATLRGVVDNFLAKNEAPLPKPNLLRIFVFLMQLFSASLRDVFSQWRVCPRNFPVFLSKDFP